LNKGDMMKRVLELKLVALCSLFIGLAVGFIIGKVA